MDLIDNIHIYILLIVKNKEVVSDTTILILLLKIKKYILGKYSLIDLKMSVAKLGNDNIYQNILLPQEKYDNENLTHIYTVVSMTLR